MNTPVYDDLVAEVGEPPLGRFKTHRQFMLERQHDKWLSKVIDASYAPETASQKDSDEKKASMTKVNGRPKRVVKKKGTGTGA